MGLLDLFKSSPEERLAKRYMAALRAVGVSHPMRFVKDEDAIHIKPPGSEHPFKAQLHNVRMELARHPDSEHERILQQFAMGMLEGQSESAATYAEAQPRLMAVIKDDTFVEFMKLVRVEAGQPAPPTLAHRPFAPGIELLVAEDMPNSFRLVMSTDPARWSIAEDTVFADAIQNSRALPASFRFHDGIWVLEQDDAYATSRLLNTAAFSELALKGAPVVIIPDRHTLAVTGAEDLQGLEALARALDACVREARRPISATPLMLTPTGWTEYPPEPSLQTAFGNPRGLLQANFWSEYKAALEKALAARGEDIFVASLSLQESQDSGAYESFAVWSKDVDTILPAADRIMFYEGEKLPVRRADWRDVRRVMGTAMEQLPAAPERYRVRSYPTPEQFVAMGAAQVERRS